MVPKESPERGSLNENAMEEIEEKHYKDTSNNVTTIVKGHSVKVWEYYEWYHNRWDPVYFRRMIDVRYPKDNYAVMTFTRATSTGD